MKLPPFKDYRSLAESFRGDGFYEHGWWPAWLGFFFMSMAETSGNRLERLGSWSPSAVLLLSIFVALTVGAALQAAGVGGLWLHVGAKIVGGKEGFYESVKIAGYAFFWPGLLIFPAVMVENFTFRNANGSGAVPLLIAVLWHLSVGLWGWFRTINAVRNLHNLAVWKAIVIGLWLPGLLLLVVVAIAL